jgi:hypothetical protein
MKILWENNRFVATQADGIFAVVQLTNDGVKSRGFIRDWTEKQTGRRFLQEWGTGKIFELTCGERLHEVHDPSFLTAPESHVRRA